MQKSVSTVLAVAGALTPLQPAAATSQSCLEAISKHRDAVDCQESLVADSLVWPEAMAIWPGRKAEPIIPHHTSGPCHKYRTYLREIRQAPASGNRHTISLKAIVTRLENETYTGHYQVHKTQYVCERRSGEWRILSIHTFSRFDGVNEAAERDFTLLQQ